MTVDQMADILQAKRISGDGSNEVSGVFAGDLLSHVLVKARIGDVWVTVMNSMNIVAVATLTNVACIVVADGIKVDSHVVERAEEKGIAILTTEMAMAETVHKAAEAVCG